MKKNSYLKRIISRVLLVSLIGFVGVSYSSAQDSITEKIDYVRALFGGYMSSSKDEQKGKIIDFYEKCSEEQKEAIRSFMVQAITDSLKADHKQFAMNYIDYYRTIANPDDTYLGSLVVTEGKYYYEQIDASKLSELSDYLNDIAAKSSLNYSSEISDINRMKEEVLTGCQDIEGYWVADFSDREKADPFFIRISKDNNGEYHVTTEFSSVIGSNIYGGYEYYMDISRYGNHIKWFWTVNPFLLLGGTANSSESIRTSPNTLSYIWSSEKLNVGKEVLATTLRSGVRSVSNSAIGEMARSNTYSFGTSFLSSIGVTVGEIVLNSLIDLLSVSKKRIWTITGFLTPIDKNNIDATLYIDVFSFRSDNSNMDKEDLKLDVKMVRCQWESPYVRNYIAFADAKGLRQTSRLSKEQTRNFYKTNHKAKRAKRAKRALKWSGGLNSSEALRKYNLKQLEKVKDYNNKNR